MVWSCFAARDAPRLAIVQESLNSDGYCNILSNILLPFAEDKYPRIWRYQQDNASIYTTTYTKDFLMEQEMTVM